MSSRTDSRASRPALRARGRRPCAATLCLLAAAWRHAAAAELYAAHDQVVVLDTASQKSVADLPIDEVVNGIAFSRDGVRAFVGTSGGKDPSVSRGGIYIVDTGTHRVVRRLLGDPVKELRVSADSKRLYFLEWNVRTEEKGARKKRPVKEPFRLRTLDITADEPKSLGSVVVGMNLYDLAVSPDQKTAYLLDPGHNELRVHDLKSGTFVEVVDLSGGKKADGTYFEAALSKLVVNAGGTRAAVLQSGPARTGALLVDLDGRSRRQVLLPNGSNLRAGCFLPDGKRLLALSLERLFLVDLEEGKLLKVTPLKETFTSLALAEDGGEVYLGAPVAVKTPSARGGGMVEVRDGQSFALLGQVPLPITVKFLSLAPARKPAER